MNIFVSHSSNFDYEHDLYRPLRTSPLNKQYDFFLPHEKGQDVHTRKIIEGSDMILAEVSHPSTGQGIEIGWADAAGVPIICMSKRGAKVSGSLAHLTKLFLTYSDSQDMVTQIKNQLENPTSQM